MVGSYALPAMRGGAFSIERPVLNGRNHAKLIADAKNICAAPTENPSPRIVIQNGDRKDG
ncbi:hypothetical protein [uncultured Sphingopyxis sp.]|uniref:hypothetical protein n=1 Tax=uncultured Sphingopyxis sp. TaxID=310581 RepID=UPI0025E28412|nr:hypothetical protein [uncultured Sphingopyxis sp.]